MIGVEIREVSCVHLAICMYETYIHEYRLFFRAGVRSNSCVMRFRGSVHHVLPELGFEQPLKSPTDSVQFLSDVSKLRKPWRISFQPMYAHLVACRMQSNTEHDQPASCAAAR